MLRRGHNACLVTPLLMVFWWTPLVTGQEAGNQMKPACPKSTECGTACPNVCGKPQQMICTKQCVKGKQCPKGLWRDGGCCVPKNLCGQHACRGLRCGGGSGTGGKTGTGTGGGSNHGHLSTPTNQQLRSNSASALQTNSAGAGGSSNNDENLAIAFIAAAGVVIIAIIVAATFISHKRSVAKRQQQQVPVVASTAGKKPANAIDTIRTTSFSTFSRT